MATVDPPLERPTDADEDDDVAESALVDGETTGAPDTSRNQVRREQRQLLFRSPGFIIGCAILAFWVLAAIWPDLLTSWGPKETVTDADGQSIGRSGPSGTAWWGTDRLGRDVYARVIHGARPILISIPSATLIATVLGTLIGLTLGYFRGWADEIGSRLLETVLSIPAILLAIVIVFTFGPTTPVIIGTIAFLFIPPIARTVRAATLAEAQLDYVTAARMRGESSLYIIVREIMPNVIGVVIVEVTVRLGYAVFVLTTLAFIGLSGGNATDANWGRDVSDNIRQVVNDEWWGAVFPALAIASLVIAVNLVADSLEKATKS